MDRLQRMGALACTAVALAAGPSGCGNSGSSGSTVTVAGDVPLAYVKRSTSISLAPTNGAPSAPGGDLLTLSTVAASPAITWARLEEGLVPGKARHLEVGVDRALSSNAHIRTKLFAEQQQDALVTVFRDGTPIVRNAGMLAAKGFGVTLGRRFGRAVDGSVTYTFGQTRRSGRVPFQTAPVTSFEHAEFHDLAARVETFIGWTDTRVAALCRLNSLAESNTPTLTGARGSSTSTRFDVQLTQGLPFLEPLTRADWELLLAVRNMFYEASQAGFLDELAVQDPPTRVVGGISVRF